MDQRNDLNVVDFLDKLAARDVSLWVEDDQLRFRAPKHGLTPASLATLKAHKQSIIDWLNERTAVANGTQMRYPLTHGQLGLWLDWQVDRQTSRYHLVSVATLPNDVSIPMLQSAAQRLLDRHPILQTSYPDEDGQPYQKINRDQVVDFVIVDAVTWSAESVAAWSQEMADRPFDLSNGPIMRLAVLQTATETELHWVLHHIATDYFTQELLQEEFSEIYAALRDNRPIHLPTAPLTFHDFVRWERDTLRANEESLAAFWRERFAGGDIAPLELPAKSVREQSTTRTDRLIFDLDATLLTQLRALARTHQTTLNTVLLAAYQLLLHRYTSQQDFLIITPSATRSLGGWKNAVGYYVNPLILRADVKSGQGFSTLLQDVHRTFSDVLRYQSYPYPLILRELSHQTSLNESMAGFVFVSSRQAQRNTGLFAQAHNEQRGMPQLLTLTFFESAESFRGMFTYQIERFDPALIERMAGHMQTLLKGLVAAPEQSIETLPLLTASEQQQILVDWNATAVDHPTDRFVHQLVAGRAAEQPEAIAVVHGDKTFTYGELNRRANQLAHYLQEQGDVAGTLITLYFEQSIDAIVAMLGVLKAGAAFLPIDPAYPIERVAFTLADAGSSLVLTQEHLRSRLSVADEHTTIFALDADWPDVMRLPHDEPHSPVTANQLVYTIYTSGSTGRPKGVLIEHGGLLNMVQWYCRVYSVNAADHTTQVASFAFDGSVWEIWPCLVSGATLHLVPRDLVANPPAYQTWLIDNQITYGYVPTAVIEQFVQSSWAQTGSLRAILTGGDRLQLPPNSTLPVPLYNNYGPTENSVVATASAALTTDRTPPIGKPIDNVKAYILDEFQQPRPVGVAGELYIGGASLGRGYLNRPNLTAERFVDNPFGEGRLYRTGDVVRWLSDGNIDFVGRSDFQVKIRGHRIELGEIEALLNQHPQVQAAVVEVRDQRLVGYIVEDVVGASAELRSYTQAQLPDYMVPSVFVTLDAFPLTSSDKIDRRALPDPDLSTLRTEFTAANTPTEQLLTQIWEEILDVESIGTTDDFFELGGHSLLATQVVARIQHAMGVDISLRTLFDATTIARLATIVDPQITDQSTVATIPLSDREQPLVLSHAQERLWFMEQLEGEGNVFNIPIALRMTGHLNVAALEHALQEIVRRHESLRTTFVLSDERPIQLIHSAEFTLPVIDLTHLDNEEAETAVQQLIAKENAYAFDLAAGPLFHATLVQVNDLTHFLLLNAHHIVTDGWSMQQVFNSELATLYQAFLQGQPSPLTEPTIQYADFAAWERETLQDEVLAPKLAYWAKQLQGVPPLLSLPTDRPRPPIQRRQGAIHRFEISAKAANLLRALSVESGTTLFMTMLAAYKLLLMRYSGQQDVVVGSPIANRTHLEMESLIGFFVNFVVLRSDVSADHTFRTLLEQVKTTTLEAYQYQDVPFEKIVEHLQPERNLSYTPLFQVVFNLLKNALVTTELSDLTIEAVEEEETMAKYDLSLAVIENAADEGLLCFFRYNVDLFDADTMARMATHLTMLVEAIAENPDRPIQSYMLLDSAERHKLLNTWNETQTPYPDQACFHHLFEAQVARTPDALAVLFEEMVNNQVHVHRLTYRELNERANQLAHHLCSLGVEPESVVGLCVERSLEMIIGIVAIFKAGGAYAPLDPAYPPERLEYMVTNSDVSLVLTQEKVASVLPAQTTPICIDTLPLDPLPKDNPNVSMSPDNLAYIIYTSGSTGRPKGVLVEHRGLCNTSQSQVENFGVQAGDRHLLFFSLSFDGCTADITLALRTGAAICFASQQLILPGLPMHQFLQRHEITSLILTPSALTQVPDTDLPALRTVIVAGETCPADLVARWQPNRLFLNLYGATEASIFSTIAVCRPNEQPPTVGRPVVNNIIYLLDEQRQPVPIGLPGEIYIGGVGVARGYKNRPDLTEARFLPNPFGSGRIYKTGDLGRFRSNGELEFIGRADNQVKIRGYRIELDEIETVFNAHPDVHEAAVIVRKDSGQPRLIGYAVMHNGTSVVALREFLSHTLPDYMVPASIMLLDQFPLTINGKIDRKALPAPQSRENYVAPESDIQRQLVILWRKLLEVDQVGIHDNFFDLGGHSLLIADLHTNLQAQFAQSLEITDLFQYPTVSALSDHLTKLLGQSLKTTQASDDKQKRAALRRQKKAQRQERRERRKAKRR